MTATERGSPDLVIAMRLLDTAKRGGFTFHRVAPGVDGPLLGVRDTDQWRDEVFIAGFWEPSCWATRQRKSPLVVPGDLLVTDRVSGDALNVLNTVVSRWPPPERLAPTYSAARPFTPERGR